MVRSLHGIDLTTMRVDPVLSTSFSVQLVQDISESEIKNSLDGIHNYKAHGLDGFNTLLLKKTWEVIKEDVVGGVMEFFNNFLMHSPMNNTDATLVPKVPNAN